MDNPKFPDREQIRKKWNYRVSKKRNKSDKEKNKVKLQKLEERMKRQYLSGTGGGPPMSPICEPDGDDIEMDQDQDLHTEKICTGPYRESHVQKCRKCGSARKSRTSTVQYPSLSTGFL